MRGLEEPVAWEDELATLARERGPALVGYAYLLTGDLHAAEDLVQEALVRTFRRRRTTDVEWLEAYVRSVVLNAYLDAYRARRRWAGVAHLFAGGTTTPTTSSPEAVATDRADVEAAMARLSPRERACVVLRYTEDLTVGEVAGRLGVSEGAVKRYLADARKRLGGLLADETETEILTQGSER
ncbi:sigma-70 family RNA polymerase sigma factor [Actinotalea sp. AC32]|nr:sigma-70 family RNA polymerase sigma factor [Actinotalea sp. AC32]